RGDRAVVLVPIGVGHAGTNVPAVIFAAVLPLVLVAREVGDLVRDAAGAELGFDLFRRRRRQVTLERACSPAHAAPNERRGRERFGCAVRHEDSESVYGKDELRDLLRGVAIAGLNLSFEPESVWTTGPAVERDLRHTEEAGEDHQA